MRLVSNKGFAAFRLQLFLSLLFVLSGHTLAERLPIRTYTTADGLPRDYITRIVQDSRGFLWLCTHEGLSRFDGYKFTNYGTEQGLGDREVNDFLETRAGVYWAATSKGLCRFIEEPLNEARSRGLRDTPQRFVVYYPGEGPDARSVNVICEDHNGAIWCGTSAGLFRLDSVNGSPVFSFVNIIQPAKGDSDKLRVDAIKEDRNGSLWIIAQSGLYRLRPDGGVEWYTLREGLPEGLSNTLMEDREGRIWVGSKGGLYLLTADPQPHHWVVARRFTQQDGLPGNWVKCLVQSTDGKIWAGTISGLSELLLVQNREGQSFRNHTELDGVSAGEITTLAEDRDHNLWIGAATGGVMRLAANGFATFMETDGLGGIRVGSIFNDQAGDLCVLTSNESLNLLDRGRFRAVSLTLPKGVRGWTWGWNQITFQDHAGEWWVNTGDGLVRYPKLANVFDLSRARPRAVYKIPDGLPTNSIFRLFEDSRGDIWISTLEDSQHVLTRWDRATETFHRYSPADGIPETAPTAFSEDTSGNLWIGFYSGGLLRYRDGRFRPFSDSDGVPPGMIRALYSDHAGRLWVATGEGGVSRIDNPGADRPRFVDYSVAEGLSSNQATCITEDQWGMIYVGTGRGVDELDPATGRIRQYTMADGLANSFVNVAFRHRDGSLWFGTLQGLSRLVPHPEPPTSPPPIFIMGVQVSGVTHPIPELGSPKVDGLELEPTQNHIQIDFAGLSLAAGVSLRYQYKLEGSYAEWSTPTDQRVVSYPNLPPGRYRFLVRAVGLNGTVSDRPATVSFRILPPVWQRWWFRLLGTLFIALPIAAVARYRHQRMKAARDAETALRNSREERLVELERVRTRIATDLHDDIGSTLSQIYLLSEVVRQRIGKEDDEIAEPLKMISTASHDIVSSMSDIVWAINPQKDHLSDLVQRMRRFASDTFSATNIDFRFHAPDSEADVRLGADVRREVFLIFKESVNNLIKHSGCSEANIEFDLADDSLLLRVSDNGRGFDILKESEGHGLASLRERAKSLAGQLDLSSTEGKGTTVTLNVRLGQPSV
ncbi:MAG: two-component regulator propeller domain-containing protein [Blastocatellia bacterium]